MQVCEKWVMSDSTLQQIPLVAIVGRPNVGKSTFFNRLCGGRPALVHDQPGVTRDRRYGTAEYGGIRFRMVDTAGLEETPNPQDPIATHMVAQALQALQESTLVLFVVDGKAGLLPADHDIAKRLRASQKPVLVVVNKIDNAREELASSEFYQLGWDSLFPISADHGRGIAELLDALLPFLSIPRTNTDAEQTPDDLIRVAVVGRPNAGKSSLVNALLGEPRMIVTDIPGTTRDAIDTLLTTPNQKYLLIDTAGIRRRARIHDDVEKLSVVMTQKALERADVACLVIDAQEGITEQDAKLGGWVQETGKALILVFNKIDLLTKAQRTRLHEERDRQLPFLFWAHALECSATQRTGTTKLLGEIKKVYQSFSKRVTTGALNRFAEGIVEKHPPPLYRGYPIKLYYITQAQVRPPTFVLSVNHPEGVHFSYERYLQNQIRDTFGFTGTPIRLIARAHRKNRLHNS